MNGEKSITYMIKTLDEELTIMAMLHILPQDKYKGLVLSILMLNNLTKDAVKEVFRNKDNQNDAHTTKEAAATT
ncbi:hypothetical protein H0H87_007015 [Tephrocybe sp. NHM501043]|nr:hypothetical protein H0H87_007015 [Tephrocybe sp. NHM501043]